MSRITIAHCCHVELEISINAPRERVWQAIFDDIASWWIPEFHVAGSDSRISFDREPGGRGLLEQTDSGTWLQWYSVQMYLPEQCQVYLVGNIAPDWGGPTTSNLRLALEDTEDGCILKISDSRHGNVDEQQAQTFAAGWRQLFTDGLKAFVEQAD